MRLIFRVHAIERMFRRRINEEDVRYVLTHGEEIESYPGDAPYPSRLVLGWRGSRPIHVGAAEDVDTNRARITGNPISRRGETLEVPRM